MHFFNLWQIPLIIHRIICMKKIFVFMAAFFAAVIFNSCSQKKWISDFDEGKKLAEKSGKGIFLDFCAETDEVSERLEKSGFGSADFIKKFGNDLVFVKLDLTDRLNAENLNPNASEEERAAAEKTIKETENAVKKAEMYAVQTLPAMFVLTKEGYVVSALEFYSVRDDFDTSRSDAETAPFDEVIKVDSEEEYTKKIDDAIVLLKDFDKNIKIAHSSDSVKDRVAAVDEIFDSTDFVYRYLVKDLSELVLEIDTENVSESVPRHIVALAAAEAVEAENDFAKAAKIFEEAAGKKFLTRDDRQLLYYQSALASMRINDYETAKQSLQKSIKAAPQSEQIDLLNAMLQNIEVQIQSKSQQNN